MALLFIYIKVNKLGVLQVDIGEYCVFVTFIPEVGQVAHTGDAHLSSVHQIQTGADH